MQVRVHAEVASIEEDTHDTTNTFYFTFLTGDGKPVRKVMPKSYGGESSFICLCGSIIMVLLSDGMLYIAGKRHYDELIRNQQSKR